MESPASASRMNKKRKFADMSEDDEKVVRTRRRRRSRSEPRNTGSDSAQKRETLRRLFGRYCLRESLRFSADEDFNSTDGNENEDPLYIEDPLLLDGIPECMDPEQLGFLLCAQETLRYLRQGGMSVHHTVYTSLRNRFVKALVDLGIA